MTQSQTSIKINQLQQTNTFSDSKLLPILDDFTNNSMKLIDRSDFLNSIVSNSPGNYLYIDENGLYWGAVNNFSRPNLSANGTIGGASFAVSGDNAIASSYTFYKAVDGDNSTYWIPDSYSGSYYIFYNPIGISLYSLVFKFTSVNASADISNIQGSFDGTNYVNLDFTSDDNTPTTTVSVRDKRFFKYYKITFQREEATEYYIQLSELRISAYSK